MINIGEYLKPRLNLERYIFEASDGNATLTTNIQELITCVYFDYISRNGMKAGNPQKLWEEVQEYDKKALEKISNLDTNIYNGIIGNKKWINSFFYQCKSLLGWADTDEGKLFKTKIKNMWYVHHDTGWAVHNGDINENGSTVEDRVMNGFSKFKKDIKASKKDQYQKADIYAVSTIDTPTSDVIDNEGNAINLVVDEIAYWACPFMKEGTHVEFFMGISLKQLGRVVKPEMENLSSLDDIFDVDNIKINYQHDEGIEYDDNGEIPDMRPGNVTSAMNFDITSGYDVIRKIFAIRSNGLGEGHFPLSDFYKPSKMKYTVELKGVGNKAQDGKCRSFITSLRKQKDTSIAVKDTIKNGNSDNEDTMDTDYLIMSADQIDKKINSIRALSQDCGINEFNIANLSKTEIEVLNYVSENIEDIKKVLDENADNKDVSDNIKQLAQVLKWKQIMCEILSIYEVILQTAINNADDVNGDKHLAFNRLIFDMVLSAKGLNYSGNEVHLPFLYLQG